MDVRRRQLLLGLGGGLIAAGVPRWVRGAEPDEAPAILLVAAPDFNDPLWARSVLVAAAAGGERHVGLMLNRPTGHKLRELFPNHAPSRRATQPVYFGGPTGVVQVTTVARADWKPRSTAIPLAKDAFWTTDEETIDRIIEEHPDDARFYVGHVEWRPGELRDELQRNLWKVRAVDAGILMKGEPDSLWRSLTERLEASAERGSLAPVAV